MRSAAIATTIDRQPASQPASQLACLPACQPARLPACLPACLPAGRPALPAWMLACLLARHSFANPLVCALRPAAISPAGPCAIGLPSMPPRHVAAAPVVAPQSLGGSSASASLPGVREFGRIAVASASTPGTTPVGFSIEVAVLNIGMPTADHFAAQPKKHDEASGDEGHDTPKANPCRKTYSFRWENLKICSEGGGSTPAPLAPQIFPIIFKFS